MKKDLSEILIEIRKEEEKYFENYLFYAREIKKIAQERLGKVKVIVFGSILRKNEVPRDIDILIISPELKDWETKEKLYSEILKTIGWQAPFEFHFVTEKEYEEWYSSFIKEKVEI